MEQVQRVSGVIDVVNVLADCDQTEQGAGTRRIPGTVEKIRGNLQPFRSGLDHKPIVAVHRENVTIRCHGQTQRIV